MKITPKYIFFWDTIYSNWHPCKFMANQKNWNCSEQYFMYLKAIEFKDYATAELILAAKHPRKQKELGRKIVGYDETKWAAVRYAYMVNVVYAKFVHNFDLARQLILTGDKILVEASPYDTVWGIGMGEDSVGVEDEANWKGQNLLGKALMEVREMLKKEFDEDIKDLHEPANLS